MDIGELHHLLFRWVHVVAAVLWIGHIWTLAFAERVHQPAADTWMRAWAGVAWLSGFALLIVVYYAGGALTTPAQSWGMALGVALAVLFLTWLLYDAVWTLLAQRPAAATIVSLVLLGAIAQGLAEFMTGRAVFIHLGATLGTILLNNTNQRPQRIVHNAVIAPAVMLFMISNHFPLIYGGSRPWLAAPSLVALGCATGLSLRWMSMRRGASRTGLKACPPKADSAQRRPEQCENPRARSCGISRRVASTVWRWSRVGADSSPSCITMMSPSETREAMRRTELSALRARNQLKSHSIQPNPISR